MKSVKTEAITSNSSPRRISSPVQDLLASPAEPCDQEELLRKVKELSDILYYSSDSIYVTDGQGNTLLVNEAFEQMSGLGRDEVLGRNVLDLEERGMFTPSVSSLVLRERRKITIIQELKNGTRVIATGVPIFDSRGELFRIVSNSKSLHEIRFLNQYLEDTGSVPREGCRDWDDASASIVYNSPEIEAILELIRDIAPVDTTVLLMGESGVGKGLFARLIHDLSPRKEERFVQINCGAIPESLLESELFGYEGGAFSGALKGGKPGLLEQAQGGTLFLDEIGEMPLGLQVKLLHTIQNRQITRVGGVMPVDIDTRIISATNRVLEDEVKAGRFRMDLYYRLNVVPVTIPPLRNRTSDIIALTQSFLQCQNRKYGKEVIFSSQVFDQFLSYHWPGNIRELENVVERLVVTARSRIVREGHVNPLLKNQPSFPQESLVVNKVMFLEEAREELERQLVLRAYRQGGTSYKTAELLGISQTSAHRKIQKYISRTDSEMG